MIHSHRSGRGFSLRAGPWVPLWVFVALFIALFAGPKSHAIDARAQFIREAALIPQILGAREPSIGGLHFQTILRQIPEVAPRIASATEIDRLNNDGRITAHWRRGRKSYEALFDFERWRTKPAVSRAQTALHECMVRLGFYDQDKKLTTLLGTLAFQKLSAEQYASIKSQIEILSRRRVAGGVVGVGGGGEIDTYTFRNALIKQSLDAYEQDPSPENQERLDQALHSNAEIKYFNPKRTYNGIKGGIWKPTAEDIKNAVCLVPRRQSCPTKSRGRPSEPCSCDGVSGVTIFPRKPLKAKSLSAEPF